MCPPGATAALNPERPGGAGLSPETYSVPWERSKYCLLSLERGDSCDYSHELHGVCGVGWGSVFFLQREAAKLQRRLCEHGLKKSELNV